jgi:transglutaminase-like putative cysteine protease
MRPVSVVLAMVAALVLTFLALTAHADEPPVTILRATNTYDVHADGTYVNDYRLEMRVANDAAARREGQQSVSYSPSLEQLQVTEAYTRKADGRVLPIAPAAIRDQLAPGTSDRGIITDLRERVMVFPDLAGGDALVYQVRRIVRRPSLPGQFFATIYLSRSEPLLDYTLTVRAPRGLRLRTEAHDLSYAETEDGDIVRRTWHASIPVADEPASALGPYDRLPRVFVSSEPDYATFARDYAALVRPHLRVTPRIQALADRVAGGVSDGREQARLLYEWVDTHIRYVALYLGNGALEPHDADAVLANGWGDCKDHVVLLNALLAARGIAAELAMVNLGNEYTLSEPPTFAQLNHAVTYLPDFDLYVDSTGLLVPFGTLPFSEYGKPTVHAVVGGTVLRQIPLLPQGAAEIALRTVATLHDDGSITGETTTHATGPFAIDLRRDAAWVQATGDGAAASSQLSALGDEGSGGFAFDPPEQLAPSYSVSGHFALDARPELLDGDSFAPPAGLRLLPRPGDVLLRPAGAHGLADDAPTPCYSGRQTEEVVLTLPAGRHLRHLPLDLRITEGVVTYRGTWTLHDATLTHRAELEVRTHAVLCRGEERRAMAAALTRIRHDLHAHVALTEQVAAEE